MSLTCQSNEFQCNKDHRCIPNHWLCDGDADCLDGEDESEKANCPGAVKSNHCTAKEFTCANLECVLSFWRCDGDPDCMDGSDEIGCK